MQRRLSKKAERAKQEGRELKDCVEYQKLRRRIAKLHKKIANQRLNFQHELASTILKNHDIVYAEDLKIKNMIRNHNLAKAISDVSWGQFLSIMEKKAAMRGKIFVKVPPHYTTQTCSFCGYVLKQEERLTLQDKEWTCPKCGTHHVRDHNSAEVILQRGQELSA